MKSEESVRNAVSSVKKEDPGMLEPRRVRFCPFLTPCHSIFAIPSET